LSPLADEDAFSLLRLCAVPRFTFACRVHPPQTSAAAASAFDEKIAKALCALSQVPVSAIASGSSTAKLAGLPLAKGGLGVRWLAPIAEAAYLASSIPEGDSQDVRVGILDTATILELKQEPRLAALLAANASSSTRIPFAPPTAATPAWGHGLFAGALQLRLGIAHLAGKTLPTETHRRCDCGFICALADWPEHIVGCANRDGFNSSSRAALMNHLVYSYVSRAAPRLVPQEQPAVAGHNGEQLFADLAIQLPAGPLVLDWVVFSSLAPSAPSAKKSEAAKGRTYPASAGVIPCAVSCRGGLSATTLRVLRGIEAACKGDKNSLVAPFILSVVSSSASILHRADIHRGATKTSGAASEPPTSTRGINIALLPELDDSDRELEFEHGKLDASALFSSALSSSPLSETTPKNSLMVGKENTKTKKSGMESTRTTTKKKMGANLSRMKCRR
jgi:hypothetical protein